MLLRRNMKNRKIINKLVDDVEEGELTEEAIENIKTGLKEIGEGKGEPIEKVAKKFGVKLKK